MTNKRATIRDVAEKAGVAISVVSYVLNDTPGQSIPKVTRDRVIEAAHELQYTPNAIARGMRTKRSMAIGVVSFWNITEFALTEILDGISNIVDANDYILVFCNLNKSKKDFNYVDLFKKRQIDGIIFISPYEPQKGFDESVHINLIKENRIPAVIINGYTSEDNISYIYMDYSQSTYCAAEYLAGLGHKNIAYLLPHRREMSMVQANERLKGYTSAVEALGLIKNEDLIFDLGNSLRIAEKIIARNGPTAVVANKTNYAQQFLCFLMDKGLRIPEDVSVIAANNEPYAQLLYPPLTTIQLPLYEIGEKAAQNVLECINGHISHAKIKMANRICERQSCKYI